MACNISILMVEADTFAQLQMRIRVCAVAKPTNPAMHVQKGVKKEITGGRGVRITKSSCGIRYFLII